MKGKGIFHPGGKQSLSKCMEQTPEDPQEWGLKWETSPWARVVPQTTPKEPQPAVVFLQLLDNAPGISPGTAPNCLESL